MEVAGEIDAATVPELTASLSQAVDAGAPCLILDLGEVTFIDSKGVIAVMDAHGQMQASGGRLVVVGSAHVRRVIEIAGEPATSLTMVQSRREALQATASVPA